MAKETTDTKAEENTEVEETEDQTTEVEDQDETTDEVDGEETDEDEDDDEDDTVPAKDLAAVKKALEAERSEKKNLAKENRALKRQLKEAATGKPEDVDAQKAIKEADARVSKYRDIAVHKEATLALTAAGAKVSPQRLIKLLDLSDVDLDDDGNVDGLEDAIEELKEDSPEFFKSDEDEEDEKPATRRAAVRKPGSVDGGKKTPPQPKKLGLAQQFAKNANLRFKN